MIMVDIRILSINRVYDFNLDEDTSIGVLIEEVTEMVLQKEKSFLIGKTEDMHLCSNKHILPKNITLRDCGIRTGDYLFMV